MTRDHGWKRGRPGGGSLPRDGGGGERGSHHLTYTLTSNASKQILPSLEKVERDDGLKRVSRFDPKSAFIDDDEGCYTTTLQTGKSEIELGEGSWSPQTGDVGKLRHPPFFCFAQTVTREREREREMLSRLLSPPPTYLLHIPAVCSGPPAGEQPVPVSFFPTPPCFSTLGVYHLREQLHLALEGKGRAKVNSHGNWISTTKFSHESFLYT